MVYFFPFFTFQGLLFVLDFPYWVLKALIIYEPKVYGRVKISPTESASTDSKPAFSGNSYLTTAEEDPSYSWFSLNVIMSNVKEWKMTHWILWRRETQLLHLYTANFFIVSQQWREIKYFSRKTDEGTIRMPYTSF